MKQVKRIVTLVISMCLLMSSVVYANGLTWENVAGNHNNSVLLSDTELSSKDEYHAIARGDFLSAGITEIINEQNGKLRINIDTYAHHNVDRIFHTVFLDQWDEDEQTWSQIDSWSFVESKEDTEDGSLSDLLTTITVSGCEVGKYYRVRGLHGVEYNDEVEATATETHGVLLTNRN